MYVIIMIMADTKTQTSPAYIRQIMTIQVTQLASD